MAVIQGFNTVGTVSVRPGIMEQWNTWHNTGVSNIYCRHKLVSGGYHIFQTINMIWHFSGH